MKNLKAKKISLTADMRDYLTSVLKSNRDLNQLQLVKEKTVANKEQLLTAIANDTVILKKLAK